MLRYPTFNANGTKVLSSVTNINKEAMMDVTVHMLQQGEELLIEEQEMETAILLLQGRLQFEYDQKVYEASRKSVLDSQPLCLHLCRGTTAIIVALEDTEILIQSTYNNKEFSTKLYLPNEVKREVLCPNKWDGTAKREVITIFDYFNAPYSNMVLGETLVPQGRWFNFTPNSHPQPKLHYYRLPTPEAFGACIVGDEAYTIRDGSCATFLDNAEHTQAASPHSSLYCCWMIKHLDKNPWTKEHRERN